MMSQYQQHQEKIYKQVKKTRMKQKPPLEEMDSLVIFFHSIAHPTLLSTPYSLPSRS